jgi:hypothetical protein
LEKSGKAFEKALAKIDKADPVVGQLMRANEHLRLINQSLHPAPAG